MKRPKVAGSARRGAAPNRTDPVVKASFLRSVQLCNVRSKVRAYLAARRALSDLGVVRSNRELQGEFAEWFVARLLGLTLEGPFKKGHDAADAASGERYEIKSQQVPSLSAGTSFHFKHDLSGFDWFVAVFLSEEMDPLAVVRILRTHVDTHATTSSKGRHLTWTEEHFRQPWVETIWRAGSGRR